MILTPIHGPTACDPALVVLPFDDRVELGYLFPRDIM